MKRSQLFCALILTIAFAGCGKEESSSVQTPPPPPKAAGTMSAKVNGNLWSAGGNPTGGRSAYATYDGFTLTIYGKKYNAPLTTGTGISLNVKAFGTGTFALGNPYDLTAVAFALYSIDSPVSYSSTNGSTHTGTLVITKVDQTNRIVTGTFSFNATGSAGEYTITEGAFDVELTQ